MKFENKSWAHALMMRNTSGRSDAHMLGCVIARKTFRIEDGLVATPDDPWPISPAPYDTPLGQAPADKAVYSGGVDVLVGGEVTQPGRNPRTTLEVRIEVGARFQRRIAVFGERQWVRTDAGDIVASAPLPFRVMPLTYERAYGGYAQTPYGIRMPCSTNPLGRGFCLVDDEAPGMLLPNLEDPKALIQSPSDQPYPVGTGYYPEGGGLAKLASLEHPGAVAMREGTPAVSMGIDQPLSPDQLNPMLYNGAHPEMVIPAKRSPKPGDRVLVTHGMPRGDLAFEIPAEQMQVRVELADRRHVFPMVLDQIAVICGAGVVMLGYRCVFEYRTVVGEKRRAILEDRGAGATRGVSRRGAHDARPG